MHLARSEPRYIVLVVFLALVIDIFSFAIILPLLPRLLDHYRTVELASEYSLLRILFEGLQTYKQWAKVPENNPRIDVVLFGGFISALFSVLQAIASPLIGRLSDKHGRRPILLVCMIGNIASCLLWVVAARFPLFLLARIVGGLFEGNVQLSIAMITDITSKEHRAKGLALVGIAFAIGFTLGPAIGAIIAQYLVFDLEILGNMVHPYSGPAILSLVLVFVEFLVIVFYLPETKKNCVQEAPDCKKPVEDHRKRVSIQRLSRVHMSFLFLFSGIEFTLPFLTFEKFAFTHVQQGKMFFAMGLLVASIQACYTRRFASKIGEFWIAVQGILSCAGAYFLLAFAPNHVFLASALIAFTSATVVTSLTSLCSLLVANQSISGTELGTFRSWGQVGRATGPFVISTSYWMLGSTKTYLFAGVTMFFIPIYLYLVSRKSLLKTPALKLK